MNWSLLLLLVLIFYLYSFYFKRCESYNLNAYMDIDLRDICKRINCNDSKKTSKQLKQDEYDDHSDINNLYYGKSNFPLAGDDNLTYRMHEMGQKNKQAMDNRAMFDKNSFLPYIEEELRSHSNSIWWDDETLENEF